MSANDPRWRVSHTFMFLPCWQCCRATQRAPCQWRHSRFKACSGAVLLSIYIVAITSNTVVPPLHLKWAREVFYSSTNCTRLWIYFRLIRLSWNRVGLDMVCQVLSTCYMQPSFDKNSNSIRFRTTDSSCHSAFLSTSCAVINNPVWRQK